MQQTTKAAALLLALFLLTQLIGFFILEGYRQKDLPLGLEPPVEGQASYLPVIIGLIIATAVALLLIHFNAIRVWQYWFFLSVFVCLFLAFAAFIATLVALLIAGVLAYLKIFHPNIYIQNLTELFIYGGLAALIVPLLTLTTIMLLLLIMAIYDVIAVYKTRHMVTLADFQRKANLFAGLQITYAKEQTHHKLPSLTKQDAQQFILGGGDIGFPLLFTGILYLQTGFKEAFFVSICAAAGLFVLFQIAKAKRYYPAMPFVVAGCFLGYAVLQFL